MKSLLRKEILSKADHLIKKEQTLFYQQDFAEAKGCQKEAGVKTWKVGSFFPTFSIQSSRE